MMLTRQEPTPQELTVDYVRNKLKYFGIELLKAGNVYTAISYTHRFAMVQHSTLNVFDIAVFHNNSRIFYRIVSFNKYGQSAYIQEIIDLFTSSITKSEAAIRACVPNLIAQCKGLDKYFKALGYADIMDFLIVSARNVNMQSNAELELIRTKDGITINIFSQDIHCSKLLGFRNNEQFRRTVMPLFKNVYGFGYYFYRQNNHKYVTQDVTGMYVLSLNFLCAQ